MAQAERGSGARPSALCRASITRDDHELPPVMAVRGLFTSPGKMRGGCFRVRRARIGVGRRRLLEGIADGWTINRDAPEIAWCEIRPRARQGIQPFDDPGLFGRIIAAEIHAVDSDSAGAIRHGVFVHDGVTIENGSAHPDCLETLPMPVLGLQFGLAAPGPDQECELRERGWRGWVENLI